MFLLLNNWRDTIKVKIGYLKYNLYRYKELNNNIIQRINYRYKELKIIITPAFKLIKHRIGVTNETIIRITSSI